MPKDMMPHFELFQPTSLDAALELVDQWGERGWKLAGGHDGTVKLMKSAHDRLSMAGFHHGSAGTRHLIPHTERTRSQETVVSGPKQVTCNTKEIEHKSMH